MRNLDLAGIQKIIAEVAISEIIPRFRKLQHGDIEMKGVDDPVTIADKAAEHALTLRLTECFPGSTVVGEESFAADPRILSRFGGDEDVWVIDPIDGTRNFVSGKPEFAVMVALVRNKQAIASWIHDPNTGDTLSAEQGSGVWLEGKKMRLSGQDGSVTKIAIVGSRLQKLLSHPNGPALLAKLPQFETGSAAAFDYGRLFTGEAVFAKSTASRAAFLLYRQSKAWDHVPGLCMVAEALGYAADLTGKAYDMQNGQNGLLVAPDFDTWTSFQKSFNPLIEGLIASS